jgi:DNA-binding NarL/FixJ family response regulator
VIRVLVVDDEELVRSGLRMILEVASDIVVAAEARDGTEALAAVARHRPDVVLMDVRMPGMDGLSAAVEMSRTAEPPKVVMLTTFDLDEYVHTVAAGNAMLAPAVTKRLISSFAERGPTRSEQARKRLTELTAREYEVVCSVARGLSNAEIGRELTMSEATVKAHVSRSLAKLGLDNRVQAAILVHDADLL